MKRSTERILTTHVGSIARPNELIDLIKAKRKGDAYDTDRFWTRAREAVVDVVRRQAECGLDIVDDGEQSKSSFRSYIDERLTGFEDLRDKRGPSPYEYVRSREWQAFPEFYDVHRHGAGRVPVMTCTGPIAYKGHDELRRDLEHLRLAVEGVPHEDAFMTAVSPAYLAAVSPNEHYRTHEEYEQAVADAVREEYRAIIDAGFVLQLDDPRWITYYTLHPEITVDEWRTWAEARIEVINYAIRGLPKERIRFHTCYSINIGPRLYELEFKDIVHLLLRIDAGAYSFEGANPRHEHDYHVWENVKLPDGKVIIPGVISHTTNLVEHPELVAERILRFARLVGRENVIAGADCGFSTVAGAELEIHPSVVWPKFQALAEGARRASGLLWGKA